MPSGNFGDLTAGLIAKRLGLRVRHFVAATNVNDAVPRYLQSGLYDPKGSVRTVANAMDVGAPSNFERMQWLYGGDLDALRRDVTGFAYEDARVVAEIGRVYREHGYLLDPHGAIGWLAINDSAARPTPMPSGVFLATAHPAKFREVVEPAIGAPGAAAAGAGRRDHPSPRCLDEAVGGLRGPAGLAAIVDHATTRTLPSRSRRSAGTAAPVPIATAGICRRSAPSWDEWSSRYRELEGLIEDFRALPGHARPVGAPAPGGACARWTRLGALSYRVWYFAALQYDEDLRDNTLNGRRQQVQILFARQQQASAWFNPELLAVPLADDPGLDGGRPGAGGLPLLRREPVPRAGARARRAGGAAAVVRRAASTACPPTPIRR